MSTKTTSRLLTLDEAAERTGTSVRWWRRAVFERRIPIIKVGWLVRIDEDDLNAFIESNRRPAADEGMGG